MEQNSLDDLARRFLLWTGVCSVSAAPSFLWAMEHHDPLAMLTGVALFIVIMTAATSTQRFLAFRKRPFMRRTIYIGYAARVVMSVAFPVGMATDLLPGLLSLEIVHRLGLNAHEFWGTLVTTMIQGTILNTLVMLFMLILYGVQLATCTPPITGLNCPACGYDLRGSLDSEACPECGGDVTEQVGAAVWRLNQSAPAASGGEREAERGGFPRY